MPPNVSGVVSVGENRHDRSGIPKTRNESFKMENIRLRDKLVSEREIMLKAARHYLAAKIASNRAPARGLGSGRENIMNPAQAILRTELTPTCALGGEFGCIGLFGFNKESELCHLCKATRPEIISFRFKEAFEYAPRSCQDRDAALKAWNQWIDKSLLDVEEYGKKKEEERDPVMCENRQTGHTLVSLRNWDEHRWDCGPAVEGLFLEGHKLCSLCFTAGVENLKSYGSLNLFPMG